VQSRVNLPVLALPGTWCRLHSRRAAACFKLTEVSVEMSLMNFQRQSAEHITLVFSAIDNRVPSDHSKAADTNDAMLGFSD